jgi:hypothetical protein
MRAASVLFSARGLDDAGPVFSVDASSGQPLFTDGPFDESEEHLGGFAVVNIGYPGDGRFQRRISLRI